MANVQQYSRASDCSDPRQQPLREVCQSEQQDERHSHSQQSIVEKLKDVSEQFLDYINHLYIGHLSLQRPHFVSNWKPVKD
ncbi:MAG: hypothetical protein J1D88_02705 [Treponema sp.]|nr:hypothetical protein [Treponema sp.]